MQRRKLAVGPFFSRFFQLPSRLFKFETPRRRRRFSPIAQVAFQRLESRVLLSSVVENGATLTILLEANESLTVIATSTGYQFSSDKIFQLDSVTDTGDFSGFGTNTLTVLPSGRSRYSLFDIQDAGVGARVTFGAENAQYAYFYDNFSVTLDENSSSGAHAGLTFVDDTRFIGNVGLTADIDTYISFESGAYLRTSTGAIHLTANKSGATIGDFSGISATNATIEAIWGSVHLAGTGGVGGVGKHGVHLDGTVVHANPISPFTTKELTLVGNSGAQATESAGVLLTGERTTIAGLGATVLIQGESSTEGIGNAGVRMSGINSIAVTSAGTLEILGSAAGANPAILLEDFIEGVRWAAGLTSITADGGGGLVTANVNIGDAGATGAMAIHADTIEFGAGTVLQSSGSLRIAPVTPGRTIGIGDQSIGLLNLTAAELAAISSGFDVVEFGSWQAGKIDFRNYTLLNPTQLLAESIRVHGLIAGGDHALRLQTRRNIELWFGAQLTTHDGGVSLLANVDGSETLTGSAINFHENTLVSSGAGDIVITGRGHHGIALGAVNLISSTAAGPDAGSIQLIGHALGAGGVGVHIAGRVRSVSGDITVAGNSAFHQGVVLMSGGTVRTTGVGADAGDVFVTGRGRSSLDYLVVPAGPGARGVSLAGDGTDIHTVDGRIVVEGEGGAGSALNDGLALSDGARIGATSGSIDIIAVGGAGDSAGFRTFGTGGGRVVSLGSASIEIIATGAGVASDISLGAGTLIGSATATGNIALRSDRNHSIDALFRSTGQLTLAPRSAGVALDNGYVMNAAWQSSFSEVVIGDAQTGPVALSSLAAVSHVSITGSSVSAMGTQAAGRIVTLNATTGAITNFHQTAAANLRLQGVVDAFGSNAGNSLVNGNITFLPGSTLRTEITALGAGVGFDRIYVTGANRTISLNDAVLDVTVHPGFTMSLQALFQLMYFETSGTVVGTFNGLPDRSIYSTNGRAFGVGYNQDYNAFFNRGVYLTNLTDLPPELFGLAAAQTYSANSAPVPLWPNGSGPGRQGMHFVVQLVDGRPSDRLVLLPNATTLKFQNNQVLQHNQIIGEYSGGVGSNPLVIQLFEVSNISNVPAASSVVRAIAYVNQTPTPSTGQRSVTIQVTNSQNMASPVYQSTLTVLPTPTIQDFGGATTYFAGDPDFRIAQSVRLGSGGNRFARGVLTVQLTDGRPSDRLSITPASDVTLVNSEVLYHGVAVGAFTGGAGATPLQITLNGAATYDAVQRVLRQVAFGNVTPTPSAGDRQVRVTFTDGDGLISQPATRLITVSDSPVIRGINDSTYMAGLPGISIAASANVFDGGGQIAGSVLRVWLTTGRPQDRLFIAESAELQLSANQVFLQGNLVATFSGGVADAPLNVQFNANATINVIQRVLRAIQFTSASTSPSPGPRQLSFRLTDGAGNMGVVVLQTVTVSPQPTLTAPTESFTYIAAAQPTFIGVGGRVFGVQGAFANSTLSLRITAGGPNDRLTLLNGRGVIVEGGAIIVDGQTIGALSGGAGTLPLTATFNAFADEQRVNRVLAQIAFFNVSLTPTPGTRQFTLDYRDGFGRASNTVTGSIQVTSAS